MTAPAVSTDSATAPSATPLEQDIGQMFGDYSISAEPPEPETSAAGTTPAEPVEGTAPEPDAEAPKAGADGTEPQSEGTTPGATTATLEDDPWKDTTPAEYVVNGKSIPVEDIRVFKEGGAAIRPEALPNVLSKLAERETLAERVQVRDREYTTLAKAVEWSDPSGKTFSGPDAAIELRIGNASMFAENRLIVQAITDPDILARCLTTAKGADGIERVVFSPHAIEDMKREVALQQREIVQAMRAHYATTLAEAAKPAPAPIDYPKAADALVADLATAAKLDASVLTPQDRAMLAKQLPFHIQKGLASLEWQELVKDRIAERIAQKQTAVQIASTTADATKKGNAAMMAARFGVKPPARPAALPPKPVTPTNERAANESDAFDQLLSSGAAAMRAAR